MSDGFWPYLVVILAGFLPNEVFRAAAVLLGGRIDDRSEVFVWIKFVAVALLAAVVSKLLFSPAAVPMPVPTWLRFAVVAFGVGCYFVLRRSLLLGILCGEAAMVAIAWLYAR